MPSIMRIDVDRNLFLGRKDLPTTFLPSVKTLTKNIPLAFSFNTGFLFGKKKKCMIKDLNDRGIKASLFFQPFTVPNKKFAQELLKEGHSIRLHAVHTEDFKDFSRDLKTGG